MTVTSLRYFYTYFDKHYLPNGLALLESLRRHAGPFLLHVLALDDDTHAFLGNGAFPEVRSVPLKAVEAYDRALAEVRRSRKAIEYYYTLSPIWPLYLLDRYPEVDQMTYLDADLFFYSSLQPLFDQMGSASIQITRHRYPPDQAAERERNCGIFNVSYLSFRRDGNAMACLRWWRDRCLEWCYDRIEDGKYGDQKYLDQWPSLFDGVTVLDHPGACLGPWNLGSHGISRVGGVVQVDGMPLISFHFSGFRLVNRWALRPAVDTSMITSEHLRWIFLPYAGNIARWCRETGIADPSESRRSGYISGWELIAGLGRRQYALCNPGWAASLLWGGGGLLHRG